MTEAELEIMLISAIKNSAQGIAAQMAPHEAPDELLTVVEVGKVLGIGKNAANHLVPLQRGVFE